MRIAILIAVLSSLVLVILSVAQTAPPSITEPTTYSDQEISSESTRISTDTADSSVTATTTTVDHENAAPAALNTPKEKKTTPNNISSTVLLPPVSGMYFGAFADFDAYEDKVSTQAVSKFESLIDADIAWGYFSNNWFDGIEFPHEQVDALIEAEVTPYIRMMPRTNFSPTPKNWTYTLERIADGAFDDDLRRWARAAKDTETPLIIEFGTEVNGDWFPWNGRYNGRGITTEYGDDTKPDGPERFIAAYRHIIDLFREEEVMNVTWVYHLNAQSSPEASWNQPMSYYPGDEYIDWIGVSVYGAQHPDDPWTSFVSVFDDAYNEIVSATEKPIAIVEFGLAEGPNPQSKAHWLQNMFATFHDGLYPRVYALSYWHSSWTNEDGSISNLRIDSSPRSLEVFVKELQNPMYVSETRFGPR